MSGNRIALFWFSSWAVFLSNIKDTKEMQPSNDVLDFDPFPSWISKQHSGRESKHNKRRTNYHHQRQDRNGLVTEVCQSCNNFTLKVNAAHFSHALQILTITRGSEALTCSSFRKIALSNTFCSILLHDTQKGLKDTSLYHHAFSCLKYSPYST